MAEYIEREALLRDIENDSMTVLFDKTSAIHHIKRQPVACVSEVKRGKNVTEMNPVDEFVCSECGFACEGYSESVHDEFGNYRYYRECEFNYCPACGAKMDKKEGETHEQN